MKIVINKKNLKINLINNLKVKKKLIRYKEHTLILFGNCYEILDKKKIFENTKILTSLNGEFFFIYKNRNNKKIILGNSSTSYYQIYFTENNDIFEASFDIFSLIKYSSKINFNKISEWLYLNGRNLDQKTFIKGVKILHPGLQINFKNNKSRIFESKLFYYSKDNNKILNFEQNLKKELTNAIKLRFEKVNSNVTFGLSGGYDSRIILSLIPNEYKKKIFACTVGDKFSLEKISARKVAKLLSINHKNILINNDSYYDYAFKILDYGNYNNIFKGGVKENIYKKIFKKDKSNHFIQGNALDVLIASSFSNKELFKIKNLNQYLNWYLDKNELFSLSEIKKILKNKSYLNKNLLKSALRKRINKIKFNNDYVNLNDSLTFDLRIKRWHNPSLSVFIPITNMLIPTYDKNFLNACSIIPSHLRINDKFRRKLLININKDLLNVPRPENLLKLKKYRKFHTFDSDLGKDFKTNKKFNQLIDKTTLYNFENFNNFLDLKYIKEIISKHTDTKNDYQRKIFMIITLMIFMKKFNKIKMKN